MLLNLYFSILVSNNNNNNTFFVDVRRSYSELLKLAYFVIDTLASNGISETPILQRIFWAAIEGKDSFIAIFNHFKVHFAIGSIRRF